jgi:hypothetical protein
MRLFCVKTIFTPHSLVEQSDAIEKLIIFILMTGGNSSQGHPVNGHTRRKKKPILIVCSCYHDCHLGISIDMT